MRRVRWGHVRQLRADACGKPHLRLIGRLDSLLSLVSRLSSFVRGVNAEAALGCAGRQAFDASGGRRRTAADPCDADAASGRR